MRVTWLLLAMMLVLDLGFALRRADAQAHRPQCDRRMSRITFGTDGGNMRPISTTIAADGRVTRSRDTLSAPETLSRVDTTVVRALTRLAWIGSVRTHRLTSARALANRDMAYEFIEVASPCERRRAEFQGEAPPRFRELYARLNALVQ